MKLVATALVASLAAVTLTAAAPAGATTYHWTLAKRVHLVFPVGTVQKVVDLNVKNANGIAVSLKTPKRTNLDVFGLGTCKHGSTVLPIEISFMSHGLGTKVPVKIPAATPSPNSCAAPLTISPQNSSALTAIVSIWRR